MAFNVQLKNSTKKENDDPNSSLATRHWSLFYQSFISPLRFFAWAVGDALHTVVHALLLAVAGDANRMRRHVNGPPTPSPAFPKKPEQETRRRL